MDVLLNPGLESLEIILQAISEPVMVQDSEFRCIYANDLAAQMCGYESAAQFKDQSISSLLNQYEILTEDGAPFPSEQLTARRVLAGENLAEVVYQSRNIVTGDIRWTHSLSRPIRGADKRVLYAMTIFRDITAEKTAERNARFLGKASGIFGSSLNFQETIKSLGELIVPELADWYGIDLLNRDNKLEVIHAANINPEHVQLALKMRRDYPPNPNEELGIPKVLRTGEPDLMEYIPPELFDLAAQSEEHLHMLKTLDLSSYLILPLKVREQTIGVLNLCHIRTSGRRFTKKDIPFLQEVSQRIALALENSRLYSMAQRSEERLQLALQGSKIGLWEWSFKDKKIFLSERCLEIFGLTADQFQGNYSEFLNIVHPADLTFVLHSITQMMQFEKEYSIEFRIIRQSDQAEVWIQAQGQTHNQIDASQPVRLVGTVIDVSRQKNNEEIRRKMEQKVAKLQTISAYLSKAVTPLEMAQVIINEGLRAIDADAGSVYIKNDKTRHLELLYSQGYNGKVVSPWSKISFDEEVPLIDAFKTSRPIILDSPEMAINLYPKMAAGIAETNSKCWVAVPLIAQNECFGAIGFSFSKNNIRVTQVDYIQSLADNTAQALDRARIYQEAEDERMKAHKANQAKSLFLANMSHEIRTPMNAILGFSKLLREKNVSEQDREDFIRRIETNGDHLLHLIDDILDLSRVEAGQMKVEKKSFFLKEMLWDVEESLKMLVVSKDIRVEMHLDTWVPNRIQSDPVRLKQVLMNLIGNSAKFTQTGFIRIQVQSDVEKKLLKFDVEDSGLGISASVQGQLFKPFSQGDDSITRKFGGTGLGLVLSRKISESIGGKLELVRSEKGKGTLFRVTIPWVNGEDPDDYKPVTVAEPVLKNDKKTIKILLAEDVYDNQLLIDLYLRHSNVQLTVASNGVEAVQKAHSGPYDLILMDIQMPQMDGLEATRQIRANGYQGPILALTAHALPEEIKNSLSAGCNGHLTKPISKSVLLQQIKNLTSVSPTY